MAPTRILRRALLLSLLLAALQACALTPRSAEGDVYVEVANRRPEMMTIYAIRHSMRMRMGMVQGNQTKRLLIRPQMIGPGGEVQLAIDPLGNPNESYTRTIYVQPGDVLRLELN